jgi:5-amino-6-(5-phosphoribosylamino)uracil reductase
MMGRMRPHVMLSAAMSLDGYLDDASAGRLLLSNAEDFDRVDAARAAVDAVMVGAETIRRDDPRLLVNDEERRAARESTGLSPFPVKVTVTAAGALRPEARFFTTGGEKLVYCATPTVEAQRALLAATAASAEPASAADTATATTATTVIDAGDPIDLAALLDDLGARGVRTLMVEGGTSLHTRFLQEGLADELQLAIAPFFVGDAAAPRFVTPGRFPQDAKHRMILAETYPIGDMVFAHYVIRRGQT